jgi:hypothetical protein
MPPPAKKIAPRLERPRGKGYLGFFFGRENMKSYVLLAIDYLFRQICQAKKSASDDFDGFRGGPVT